MSNIKGINIKIYFTDSYGNEEVRRFFFPGNPPTSYEFLKKKITSLYNFDNVQNFKIQWKDSEGDLVTVSCDDELSEAVSEFINDEGEQFLRLYVTASEFSHRSDNIKSDEDKVHEGVRCDGCDGIVAGNRFKCQTCYDYDLCEKCESKGIHKHHAFKKISHPSDNGSGNKQTSFGCRKGPEGAGRSFRQNGDHPGCNRGNNHQQQQQNCPRFGGRRDRQGPCPFQWNFPGLPAGPFVGVGAGVPGAPPFFSGIGTNAQFPDAAKVAEEASKFASDMATKHVADVMKGIWTAWSGNSQNNNSGNASKQPKSAPSTPGANEANIPTPHINIGITVDENGQKKTFSFGTNDMKSDNGGQSKAKTETEPKKSDEEEAAKAPSPDPFMDVETPEEPDNTASSAPSPDDWTLLNQDNASAPSGGPIYPDLEAVASGGRNDKPEDQQPHPNEKVRKALIQMENMGYSNEGGWLTQLLEMKNGDLNQVLDLLLVPKK